MCIRDRFVRDWMPARVTSTPEGTLRAYRIATVGYGVVSGFLSLLVVKSGLSLLSLLLFGYATVVPPAIAMFFLIYWKRTTEASAFWGMGLGYVVSVVSYALVRLGVSTWDPSYASTLVPLVAIPLIALATPAKEDPSAAAFHKALQSKAAS